MKRKSELISAALILLFLSAAGGLVAMRAKLCAPEVPASAASPESDRAKGPLPMKAHDRKSLYAQYRHIERVVLRDGTVLFGVMHESGSITELLTSYGSLRIPREDIVRVEYMSQDSI